MIRNEYKLNVIPSPYQAYSAQDDSVLSGLYWSNVKPIPPIGTSLRVKINQCGWGVVQSYFIERGDANGKYGFIGLCVRLDQPPAWKVKQQGIERARQMLAFGTEVEY